MIKPQNHYRSELEKWVAKEKQQVKSVRVLSLFRLAAFVVTIVGVYYHLKLENAWWLIPAVVGVGLFLHFIKRHIAAKKQRDFMREMIGGYGLELAMLSGNWENNDGLHSSYEDHKHPYAHDLDLFGRHSIFSWINRTTTVMGEEQLVAEMKGGIEKNEIAVRQQTLTEFTSNLDVLHEALAYARMAEFSDKDRNRLMRFATTEDYLFQSRIWPILLWFVPIASIAATCSYVMNMVSGVPFAAVLLFPLIIVGVYFKKISARHQQLSRMSSAIDALSETCNNALKVQCSTPEWQSIAQSLSDGQANFDSLASQLDKLDYRNNFIVGIILNSVLLWDIRCIRKLENWLVENKQKLDQWLMAIGDFQKLASLSINVFNTKEHNCWPELNTEVGLKTEGLMHPTLLAGGGIAQEFDQSTPVHIALVTGANMAGKSTFLRAIGVSWMMANMGSVVLAKEYVWNAAKLFSSMRTSDSLIDGSSYFHAELSRLQQLVNYGNEHKDVMVLLDEILKGTNSKDKAEGSASFVRKLAKMQLQAIVATHDLSLCSLESELPNQVVNWYFDVNIVDDDLSFDYTIRQGVCQTMNAAFLMKKMGIV